MASADAVSPTPAAQQLQTVVLRVSIHCLGCKKKVRKVLRSIEGVKDVKVDAAMHKVTVTGTVDGDTLVKRLYKSGKQALPWQHPHVAPAPPAAAATKAIEATPPETQAAPAGDGDAATPVTKLEEEVKDTTGESSEKKTEEGAGAESEKKPKAEKQAEKKVEEEEAKPAVDEPEKDASESEAKPPAETKAAKGGDAEPAAKTATNDEDDGGAKKEQEEKSTKPPKDAADAAAATTTQRSLHFSPSPAKHAYEEHQQHQHYPYPYYSTPVPTPQPVMSYHMAQPTTSASYYAPRPEPASYSSPTQPAYSSVHQPQTRTEPMHHQQQSQWSPSYLYMPYPHSSPDSYYRDYYAPPSPPPLHDEYRMFDDENPNACTVM